MRSLLFVTDVGFIVYWLATMCRWVPEAWMFRGHADPTVASWNLSFLPLDLLVSATGLGSLALRRACPHASRLLLTISLACTSISGLQAISFWTLRGDYDAGWWAPNLFLLLWPIPYLVWMTCTAHRLSADDATGPLAV